jgi:medium-chain acyl-[acyl-carrier-protein] hydrolase
MLTMKPSSISNQWFVGLPPGPQQQMRLFCFPYAGGSSAIYRGWSKALPKEVAVIPVELPGRGTRLKEPALRKLPELVAALKAAITPLLDKDYVLFGHSMGALIAFELARALRRGSWRQPRHIFVSGRRAPQIPPERHATYHLPQPDFIKELAKLNGTPKEVLNHPELMEMMLPLLRADFELVETYEFRNEEPLKCPITVYGGVYDEGVPYKVLAPWREQTSSDCDIRMFRGDHFFLRSVESEVLAQLRLHLQTRIHAARSTSP